MSPLAALPDHSHDSAPDGDSGPRSAVALQGDGLIRCNRDVDWQSFDSKWYFEHNYSLVRDDDRKIIGELRRFFAKHVKGQVDDGIDVGTGTNLYPLLAMSPFCRKITVWEHSQSNVEWLRGQLESPLGSWQAFWDLYTRRPWYWLPIADPGRRYRATDPQSNLQKRVSVELRSLLDLEPEPTPRWGLGTMFFVAESMTEDHQEFVEATKKFVKSLRPGAPFAAAFMEKSEGYVVGSYRYPAVPVTIDDIRKCLSDLVDPTDFDVMPIESKHPLREGYSGTMLLALGVVK